MSKLCNMLEDMIAAAKTKAGTPIRRQLHKGLRIEIVSVSTALRLTLVRENAYPSMDEWDTVVRHFPYPIQATYPLPRQEGNRHTLSARIPAPGVMELKYL